MQWRFDEEATFSMKKVPGGACAGQYADARGKQSNSKNWLCQLTEALLSVVNAKLPTCTASSIGGPPC